MYNMQAEVLFENVACPHCNEPIETHKDDPTGEFQGLIDDPTLSDKCRAFNRELNAQFDSFQAGQLDEPAFRLWLEQFRQTASGS